MCGENTRRHRIIQTRSGSPPRVRGKPETKASHEGIAGITPACAGKTCGHRPRGHLATDHPRVCGENRTLFSDIFRIRGSPPRVRGKQRNLSRLLSQCRITPACAGKTPFALLSPCRLADHPRVCGENGTSICVVPYSSGSPPRVRGKQ